MDNTSIKSNIQHFRKDKGYTQEMMASKLGTSVTHYRSIESGNTILLKPIVGKIARVLGVDEKDLLEGQFEGKVLEDCEEPYQTEKHQSGNLELLEIYNELNQCKIQVKMLEASVRDKDTHIQDLQCAIRILKKSKGFDDGTEPE